MNCEHVSASPDIDLARLRAYRHARVRAEMRVRDIAACILVDPVNIRYATGARNMQVFTARNPARYVFLPVEGPTVLFEFAGAEHLGADLDTVQEVRTATTASYVAAGTAIATVEKQWARELASLIEEHCGGGAKVGVERVNAGAALALSDHGFTVVDAQQPVERARAIKSADEVACVRASLRATEEAVHAVRDAIQPGMTENQLWANFHFVVIAQGADYIETRLLNSGPATNPWFQETSNRVIEPDTLIAFDTDVVGCHGYYSDFSRTFHAGPNTPTTAQRELYRAAFEQVQHNLGVIGPDVTFREYAERAWPMPEQYQAHRYFLSAHGCGMTGEYPYLYHRQDFDELGYEGVIEPGMTLCVESFIGRADGGEGVKLEQQILVTEDGTELLSRFPFEDSLLGS